MFDVYGLTHQTAICINTECGDFQGSNSTQLWRAL